jgi:hypothetical protein
MSGYVVLAPQGLPLAMDCRERCLDLIRRAGGDLTRLYETTNHENVGRLAPALSRVMGRQCEALVVLTKTCPLPLTVLRERRTISSVCPDLRVAAWIIYADPVADPYFFEAARSSGTFDRAPQEAPIWRSKADGLDYLVLTPLTDVDAADPLLGRVAATTRHRTHTSMRLLAAG